MDSEAPQWHGLPRAFWYLWLGVLINRLGGFVATFLAIYLTQDRHFSVESAGFVVSLYGAGSLCAGPLGGALSDRIGRRTTLLIALLGAAAAMVNLGLSREYWRIAVGAMVLGCLSDLGRPASNAAIADLVPPADRTRAYGLLYWAINLGFAGAAMLAGLLARFDFLWLFLGDATTTTLFGLIVLLRIPETLPKAREKSPGEVGDPAAAAPGRDLFRPYRDGVFVTFVVIQFTVAWVFCQFAASLPLDMARHGIPMPRYGQLVAINGILIVLLQPLVLRHIGRVPRALRGSYQGAFQLAWGAASLLGPALGGLVMGRLGARPLWLICLAIGVVAAVLHLVTAGPRRRRFAELAQTDEQSRSALAREDGSP
jgi:MFS family permease